VPYNIREDILFEGLKKLREHAVRRYGEELPVTKITHIYVDRNDVINTAFAEFASMPFGRLRMVGRYVSYGGFVR
jgi:hypothetical protein